MPQALGTSPAMPAKLILHESRWEVSVRVTPKGGELVVGPRSTRLKPGVMTGPAIG